VTLCYFSPQNYVYNFREELQRFIVSHQQFGIPLYVELLIVTKWSSKGDDADTTVIGEDRLPMRRADIVFIDELVTEADKLSSISSHVWRNVFQPVHMKPTF
jgi:hypothetical protein